MPHPLRDRLELLWWLAASALVFPVAVLVVGLPAAPAVVLVLRWYRWLERVL